MGPNTFQTSLAYALYVNFNCFPTTGINHFVSRYPDPPTPLGGIFAVAPLIGGKPLHLILEVGATN